jgi:hypothetical protein
MKKTVKVVAGLGVLGLFVLVSLMRLGVVDFGTQLDSAPYTTTCLYAFRHAIGEMVGPGDNTIEQMLSENSTNELQRSLASLFTSRGYQTVANHLNLPDGWGRPYQIEWRTNLFGVDTPMIHATDNELLIWSAGPNGINEYGGGDDLFDSCDWEMYKHVYKRRMEEMAGSSQSDE